MAAEPVESLTAATVTSGGLEGLVPSAIIAGAVLGIAASRGGSEIGLA